MIPSFTTSKPPTIPSSVANDNSFSRVLKAGKLETDALSLGPSMTGSLVLGTTTVSGRSAVAGTAAFTYTGIRSDDFVQVALKTAATAVGAGYSVAYVALAGAVPAHFVVTSVSAVAATVTTDVSTVNYLVFKTFV